MTASDPAARLRAAADLLDSLDKAATPGPWQSREVADGESFHIYGDFGWVVRGPGFEGEDSERGKADVDLTATMRNAAPHLAAWLRATAEEIGLGTTPGGLIASMAWPETWTAAEAVADAVLLASANTPAQEGKP